MVRHVLSGFDRTAGYARTRATERMIARFLAQPRAGDVEFGSRLIMIRRPPMKSARPLSRTHTLQKPSINVPAKTNPRFVGVFHTLNQRRARLYY